MVGADGRWAEVDAELCEVLGRTEAELARFPVEAVLHPADAADERARHRQLLAGVLHGYRARLRLVRGDGRVAWAVVDARVAAGPQGRPAGIALVVQDVTARRELEGAGSGWSVGAPEAEDSVGLVAIKDADGRFTRVNARFEERFRVSAAVLRGRDDAYLFPPATASALRANDALAAGAAGLVEGRDVIPLADGDHAFAAFRFALLGPTGAPHGVCAVWAEPADRDAGAALAERLLARDRRSRDDAIRALDELGRAEAAARRAAVARLRAFVEASGSLHLADAVTDAPPADDDLEAARAESRRLEADLARTAEERRRLADRLDTARDGIDFVERELAAARERAERQGEETRERADRTERELLRVLAVLGGRSGVVGDALLADALRALADPPDQSTVAPVTRNPWVRSGGHTTPVAKRLP